MSQQTVTKGIYIRLVLTMFFWGGTFVAGRFIATEIDPYLAATGRFITASLFLLGYSFLKKKPLPRLNLSQWFAMILLGLTGVYSYNICFFTGLQSVEAGRGAMIIAANPVVITLLAVLLLGERFNLQKCLGMVISIAGALLVISKGDLLLLLSGTVGLGELYMIGCVFSWAAYAIIGKKQLAKVQPIAAVTYSCIIGALFLLLTTIFHPQAGDLSNLSPTGCLAIIYLALFGTALGFIWFYQGIQVLGAGRTSLFVNLVPISGVILGIIFLHEQPDISLLAGGLLVLTGLYLVNRPSPGLSQQ